MKFDFNNRGQVSAEMLFSVIILLIFLIDVFVQNSIVSASTNSVSISYSNKSQCLKLAFSLSEVFSQGPGAKIMLELEKDATVHSTTRQVIVGDEFCSFTAKTNDYSLSAGQVILENNNWIVEAH